MNSITVVNKIIAVYLMGSYLYMNSITVDNLETFSNHYAYHSRHDGLCILHPFVVAWVGGEIEGDLQINDYFQ